MRGMGEGDRLGPQRPAPVSWDSVSLHAWASCCAVASRCASLSFACTPRSTRAHAHRTGRSPQAKDSRPWRRLTALHA